MVLLEQRYNFRILALITAKVRQFDIRSGMSSTLRDRDDVVERCVFSHDALAAQIAAPLITLGDFVKRERLVVDVRESRLSFVTATFSILKRARLVSFVPSFIIGAFPLLILRYPVGRTLPIARLRVSRLSLAPLSPAFSVAIRVSGSRVIRRAFFALPIFAVGSIADALLFKNGWTSRFVEPSICAPLSFMRAPACLACMRPTVDASRILGELRKRFHFSALTAHARGSILIGHLTALNPV